VEGRAVDQDGGGGAGVGDECCGDLGRWGLRYIGVESVIPCGNTKYGMGRCGGSRLR